MKSGRGSGTDRSQLTALSGRGSRVTPLFGEKYMTKEEYVKKYTSIYRKVDKNNKKKAKELIDKLADVLLMMDECKQHIDEEGCVSEMCQGKYTIQRENPWSQTYNQKVKLMTTIMDRLDRLLPDAKTETVAKAGDALGAFISKGKPVELR